MSFLRHERSIRRWGFQVGLGADKHTAPLPPSHRLDESQPVIPRQVALLHCLLPLHQPVLSSLRSAGTVNRDRTKVAGFSTGTMRDFQPVLTQDRLQVSKARFPHPPAFLKSKVKKHRRRGHAATKGCRRPYDSSPSGHTSVTLSLSQVERYLTPGKS